MLQVVLIQHTPPPHSLELTGSEWSPLFGGQLDDIYGPDPTTGMHGALSDASMTATMAPLGQVGTSATGQSSSMDRYGVVYLCCGDNFYVYLSFVLQDFWCWPNCLPLLR